MNQQAAKQWVDALRSGEYTQGRNYLRKGAYFCALGVLCDAVSPKGWRKDGFGRWAHEGQATGLSKLLALKLGMQDVPEDTFYPYHPKIEGAAVCIINDVRASTFEEIADLIEKHWETI